MTEPDIEFADWAPRLGLLEMSDERRALIWGLYRLAAWVADHPEMPVPAVRARIWSSGDSWESKCAAVDDVAVALNVATESKADGDHYEAEAHFGPVEVSATAIRPERMARFRATQSYSGHVVPDSSAGGEGDDGRG